MDSIIKKFLSFLDRYYQKTVMLFSGLLIVLTPFF